MNKGEYQPDEFTETDVLRALDSRGLRYKVGHRYILSQCPTHEDQQPSCQIFVDNWFVNCLASCGRYHITKAFPELLPQRSANGSRPAPVKRTEKPKMVERQYTKYDMMEEWKRMPLIPRDHVLKGIPLEILDDLGFRWDEAKNAYFIPYFNRPQTKIPFGQWRNLSGEPRFRFLKDAQPTLYGTWNLMPNMGKIFLVEGTSDAAVLETCAIPWIAAPSAASGALVGKMVVWAHENGIQVVYAGDNDEAGNKLLDVIKEADVPYRVKQPRFPYKDWGEMFEAEGMESVEEYCMQELQPGWKRVRAWNPDEGEIDDIQTLMGGGKVIKF